MGLFNFSLSGIRASLQRLQVSAHNVSNVNTTSFKKSKVQHVEQANGTQTHVSKNMSQGDQVTTSRPWDISIEGKGYFKTTSSPDNAQYTRDGNFRVDANGTIVTSTGRQLSPEINVPDGASNVSIDATGLVTAQLPGETTSTAIGQIDLYMFSNPEGLRSTGNNHYQATENSGTPTKATPGSLGAGKIRTGSLERSNVDLTEEIIEQTLSKTSLKANIETLKAQDEMLGDIIDLQS